jgi:hypothetical protein
MKKTTKTIAAASKDILTYVPCVPKEQVDALFLQRAGAPAEGANNYLPSFLTVADHLLKNYPTFSESDCLYNAKRLDIPIDVTKAYFRKWTSVLVSLNKISETPGCYNESIFIVQSV